MLEVTNSPGDAEMTERVSDEVLQELLGLDDSSLSTYCFQKVIRELIERRRGEYICPRCALRQEAKKDYVEKFPW